MDDLSELFLLLTFPSPNLWQFLRDWYKLVDSLIPQRRLLALLRVAIMFTNAKKTVINGGIFMVNDGRRCEPTKYTSTVKILIEVHSNGAPTATYCSRCISQL